MARTKKIEKKEVVAEEIKVQPSQKMQELTDAQRNPQRIVKDYDQIAEHIFELGFKDDKKLDYPVTLDGVPTSLEEMIVKLAVKYPDSALKLIQDLSKYGKARLSTNLIHAMRLVKSKE